MQKRIADFGYEIGDLPKGKYNKITDVTGVKVGHWTSHDFTHHTGVTVILPCEGNPYRTKHVAASYVLNGYGKTAGLVQIDELGYLETPIALTGTLNVGLVHDALVEYTLSQMANPEHPNHRAVRSVNPVVGECNDGTMGDNRNRLVGTKEVFHAIETACEDFAEGAVGAGSGMICHELKGGIGSASRCVTLHDKTFTVGVLVQANHGQLADLQVQGIPIGRKIEETLKAERAPRPAEEGSCMMILATDLPLSDRQLRRVIKRCGVGLARNGSYFGHGSGDVCIGFSTANPIAENEMRAIVPQEILNENRLDIVFRAAAQATEEAVLNAMVTAESYLGLNGILYHSLAEFL